MARSFLYRFLAQAYEDPTEEGWTRMAHSDCRQILEAALRTLAATSARSRGKPPTRSCHSSRRRRSSLSTRLISPPLAMPRAADAP